uniref:Uncharacterized protein n=1 Tax=Romanomermis culicivorax TaxID=13658 RepID=A0A915KAH7_ROMCU
MNNKQAQDFELLTICSVPSEKANIDKPGDVVTVDCIENIVKKDWIDPVSNVPISENDIIYLKRAGTGFSSTNEKLEAKLARPVMELHMYTAGHVSHGRTSPLHNNRNTGSVVQMEERCTIVTETRVRIPDEQ